MVQWYVWYNGHELTIQVNFKVKCVCVGFRSNDFVTKTYPFLMDGYYKTDIISGVGHRRSDSVVLLVLRTVCCAMAGALVLYYKSLRTTSTLLRRGNISGKPYY